MERAREMLAAELAADGWSLGAMQIRDGERLMVGNVPALRAIEKALALSQPTDEDAVERVARAVRKGRFERNGMGKAYDPTVPLHETELADARAALAAMPAPVEE